MMFGLELLCIEILRNDVSKGFDAMQIDFVVNQIVGGVLLLIRRGLV
jgi:hypothetical protein